VEVSKNYPADKIVEKIKKSTRKAPKYRFIIFTTYTQEIKQCFGSPVVLG
jgi:hypothetical protein